MTDFMQEEPRQLMLDSRRLVVGGVGEEVTDSEISQLDDGDRMSNLPQDLLHCILRRLSVDDAARTSVLSKEWRYIWAMNTQLVLDKSFFSRLTSDNYTDKEAHQSRAVEMIMLVFNLDNLVSFNLYIPPEIDGCPVTRWIEHVLKKGIRYLELNNYENNAYEIPSGLFDCVTLIGLRLNTWILNPPRKCTIFTNLLQVRLTNVTFTADISFGTQLTHLNLFKCTGIKHLGSQFTKGNSLTVVTLAGGEQTDWRWFEFTSLLRRLALGSPIYSNFNPKKPIHIIKFLNKVPTIFAFYTSGFTLGVCSPGLSMTNGHATKCENVKELTLVRIGSYNLCQISNAIYLIRGLPNLQRLYIFLVDDKSRNFTAPTSNLDATDWNDMSLGQLQTVDIMNVDGSKYISQLVKILLASSPGLKVMSLQIHAGLTDPSERMKIKQELEHFPRRSSAAQVSWFQNHPYFSRQ